MTPPFAWHGKRAGVIIKAPDNLLKCARCDQQQLSAIVLDGKDRFCYPCVILTLKEWVIKKREVADLKTS